jgi:hypothetical protein
MELYLWGRRSDLPALLNAFSADPRLAPRRASVGATNLDFDIPRLVALAEAAPGPVTVTLDNAACAFALSLAPQSLKIRGSGPPAYEEPLEQLLLRLVELSAASYAFLETRKTLAASANPLLVDPTAPLRVYDLYRLNWLAQPLTSAPRWLRASNGAISTLAPPVREWIPAAGHPPSDLSDPEAAVAAYRSRFAEELTVVLHNEIPELLHPSPESLPLIDRLFWREGYAAHLKRDYVTATMIPALGAYLGFLLNGEWVPRANLLESQVILGKRAWLPFLRASRFMESTASSWEHSLTAFYREARRHPI